MNTPILEANFIFPQWWLCPPWPFNKLAVVLSETSLYYSERIWIALWIALTSNVWTENNTFCNFICQLLQYDMTYLLTHICQFTFHQERCINNCSAYPVGNFLSRLATNIYCSRNINQSIGLPSLQEFSKHLIDYQQSYHMYIVVYNVHLYTSAIFYLSSSIFLFSLHSVTPLMKNAKLLTPFFFL